MPKYTSAFTSWAKIVSQSQHNYVVEKLNKLSSACPLAPASAASKDKVSADTKVGNADSSAPGNVATKSSPKDPPKESRDKWFDCILEESKDYVAAKNHLDKKRISATACHTRFKPGKFVYTRSTKLHLKRILFVLEIPRQAGERLLVLL